MKKNIFLSTVALLSLGMLAACGGGNPSSQAPASSAAPSSAAPQSSEPAPESSAAPQSSAAPSTPGEQIDVGEIKVWCDELIHDVTVAQLEEWSNLLGNPYKATFNVQNMGEGDAATQMIADPDAGADIFFFAQDQLTRLISSGCMYAMSEEAEEYIRGRDDAGSVNAATFDNMLYAFPATSDNGYFMYYDAEFLEGVDLTSLDAIYAKCKEGGRTIYFEYGNAWYNAGFFLGYGAHCEYTVDKDGKFVAYDDTYDSEQGYEAARAMARYFTDTEVFQNGSSVAGFENKGAVVVSGTWDSAAAKKILGDKLGATILPKVKSGDNAVPVQLSSFAGFKLVGAKPQLDDDRADAVEKIAVYLTDYAAQKARFESNGWGPSNKDLQADPEIVSDPVLQAIFAQNALAKPQGQYPNSWWQIAGAIGNGIATGSDPKAAVDNYKEGLPGTLD